MASKSKVAALEIEILTNIAKLQTDMGRMARIIDQRSKQANKSLSSLEKGFNKLTNAVKVGIAAAAINVLTRAVTGLTDKVTRGATEMERMQRVFKVTSGSAVDATMQMEKLRSSADKMGIVFRSTGEAMAVFQAAAKDTKLEGAGAEKIFQNMQKAVVGLGLSSEDAKGAFLGLTQMMAKGVLQAQEVTLQVGQRIPGFIQSLAKATGKSMKGMKKMMEQGLLDAETYLLPTMEILGKMYAKPAEEAADATQAMLNKIRNSWDRTFEIMGKSKTFKFLLRQVMDFSRGIEMIFGAFDNETLKDRIERIKTSFSEGERAFGEGAQKLIKRRMEVLKDQENKVLHMVKALENKIKAKRDSGEPGFQEGDPRYKLAQRGVDARRRQAFELRMEQAQLQKILALAKINELQEKQDRLLEKGIQKEKIMKDFMAERAKAVKKLSMAERELAVTGLVEQMEKQLRAYGLTNEEIKKKLPLLRQQAKLEVELAEKQKEMFNAAKDGANKMGDEVKDRFEELKDVIRGWETEFTERLANAFMKGKFGFKDFVNYALEQLLRLQIQKNITEPLFAYLNPSDSSEKSSSKTPITPVKPSTSVGKVSVNVQNNSPSRVSVYESPGSGGKSIELVIDEITAKNMRRGNSLTSQSMRGRYGMKPIPS